MNDSRSGDIDRKFYDFQEPHSLNNFNDLCSTKYPSTDFDQSEKLFQLIRENEIGRNQIFSGPFGLRKVLYSDYTASGRSLKFIEDYINSEVLTEYGNTHTTSTVTSLQTTLFRNEARDIIRNSVNASEHDAVIFAGSGCTGCVHKLINGLNLSDPPIVFVSPFEHHSNLLPWREISDQVINISETDNGKVDLNDLKTKLEYYHENYPSKQKIGCFSAASNITGILTDVDAITVLLHQYDGLACFDYAACAPYVEVNMNPIIEGLEKIELGYKDAIFISTHKFIGGTQTPGILIAKKKLFKNKVPNGCGGGTVYFVTEKDHRYLKNEEMREEGGTPAIVESIRSGLVFQLKQACGIENIMEKEQFYARKGIEFIKTIKNLHILGSLSVKRLPIFSVLIQHEESGLYLHHNYVTALLNDLFGIQSRSGCMCAGPIAQKLLGIDYELAKTYENMLIRDDQLSDNYFQRTLHEYSQCEILRPGFTRFSFPFFMASDEVEFLLRALEFVSKEGWKLLPHYTFNLETSEWKHKNYQIFKDRKWLGHISYNDGKFAYKTNVYSQDDLNAVESFYKDCFENARNIIQTSIKQSVQLSDQSLIFNDETSKLRWFLLPSEAQQLLEGSNKFQKRSTLPFTPKKYADIHDEEPNWFLLNNIKLSKNTKSSKEKVKNSDLVNRLKVLENQNYHYDMEHISDKSANVTITINNEALNKNSGDKNTNNQINEIKSTNKIEESASKTNTAQSKTCQLNAKRNSIQANELQTQSVWKWYSPPKSIFKPFLEAISDFNMIQNGDKILVCVSGGKDSLSLLHIMKQYQYVCKSKGIYFTFGAVTVDPQTSSYDPSPLKKYLAALDIPYFYEEQCIMDSAKNLQNGCSSICSFCSRLKRGRFYHAARSNAYNVIALGQHLDDFVESFMMSIFLNGKIWTMKAHYENEEKDLRIIRPLVYVRENDLRQFAKTNHLPVITENCPACFEAPKERQRIKQLLAQQEARYRHLYNSLISAIKPVVSINKCKISIDTLSQVALKLLNKDFELYNELEKQVINTPNELTSQQD